MLKFSKLVVAVQKKLLVMKEERRTFLVDQRALFQDKDHPINHRGLRQGWRGGECGCLEEKAWAEEKSPEQNCQRVTHNRMNQGHSSQRNHRLLALSQCQPVT